MSLPAPYSQVEDASLVTGCATGDEDAWTALYARHGVLMTAIAVRVRDERRAPDVRATDDMLRAVDAFLRRNQAGALRTWAGRDLRTYLAAATRDVCVAVLQSDRPTHPPGRLAAPTVAILLNDILSATSAAEVAQSLDRLAPYVSQVVRLRLHGLDRSHISVVLGLPLAPLTALLEKVAKRLGTEGEGAESAWRVLLDLASPEERVRVALRTLEDEGFRQVRSLAEGTFREMRKRALDFDSTPPTSSECLAHPTVARLVDGSLRGGARARAESHVGACPACADAVATLVLDIRLVEPIRFCEQHRPGLALCAATLATHRYRAAHSLAEHAHGRGVRGAEHLLRLSETGLRLHAESRTASSRPPTEAERPHRAPLPSDDEAPLVALDALQRKRAEDAYHAIDDYTAKETVGARLRLLACATGLDMPQARALSRQVRERQHGDSGLRLDAEHVLAVPPERSLPQETVNDRLTDLLPQVVRYVVARR